MGRQTNKRARVESEEVDSDPIGAVEPYQGKIITIEFNSESNRERFLSLATRLKDPSRCICRKPIGQLKLEEEFDWLCDQTGCSSLAHL